MAIKFHKPVSDLVHVMSHDQTSATPTEFVYRELTREEHEYVSTLSPLTFEQALEIQKIQKGKSPEKLSPTQIKKINEVTKGIAPEEMLRRTTKQCAQACLYGLVEIKNMVDIDTGKPIDTSVAEFVKYGDPADIRELGTQIMKGSRLGDKQAKKSR